MLPTILSPVSSQVLGFIYSFPPWALSTWHWRWLLCLLLRTCVSSSSRIVPFCNHWAISALITTDLSTTYTPLWKRFPSVSVLLTTFISVISCAPVSCTLGWLWDARTLQSYPEESISPTPVTCWFASLSQFSPHLCTGLTLSTLFNIFFRNH